MLDQVGQPALVVNAGSSSLKLSEVNEASTLIQSSAHEDANIIFGAVLDEKMGEEVKITVIATGFRDQMPERRARMLSVEESPVVSVPLVAVPVESPSNWFDEQATAAASAPPRFKSEEEDEAEKAAFFFSSSAPAVATTVTVAAQQDSSYERAQADMADFAAPQMGGEVAPAPGPRDYAGDLNGQPQMAPAPERRGAEAVASVYTDSEEEQNRDLDVPAFMRRLQF